MTTVAGAGWEALRGNISTTGRDVRGVGSVAVRSAGAGSLTITFKSGRGGLWFPSTALRFPGGSGGGPVASSIKVHTDDHTAFPTANAIWEGGSVRAALVVDPCTDVERSGQRARHPPEARAARQERGTPLRTVDGAVQR